MTLTPPITENASPGYLSRKALALYAGVSLRTVANWLADHVRPLPSYRFGDRVVIKRTDFEIWALGHRQVGSTLEAKIDRKRMRVKKMVVRKLVRRRAA